MFYNQQSTDPLWAWCGAWNHVRRLMTSSWNEKSERWWSLWHCSVKVQRHVGRPVWAPQRNALLIHLLISALYTGTLLVCLASPFTSVFMAAHIGLPLYSAAVVSSLWPPCVADADIIFFALWFLSVFFFFSPNLSRRRLDVYHTCTHGVALVRI